MEKRRLERRSAPARKSATDSASQRARKAASGGGAPASYVGRTRSSSGTEGRSSGSKETASVARAVTPASSARRRESRAARALEVPVAEA